MLAATMMFGAVMCGCSGNTGAGENGISKSEFNKIELGISLSEVEHIFRGNSKSDAMTRISEKDNSTDEMYEHIVTYKVLGEKTGYAEFEFTYSNKLKGVSIPENKLTAKRQHDLS